MSLVDRVRTSIDGALHRLAAEGIFVNLASAGDGGARVLEEAARSWTVERPKRAEHGDYATNAAMVLTKKLGMPPRMIAEKLVGALGWIRAIRAVYGSALGAVGISAPERMDLPQAVEEEAIT